MSRKRFWHSLSLLVVVAMLLGLAVMPAAADGPGELVLIGVVEAMPDGGLIGQWTIDGQIVMAGEMTVFNAAAGPFEVGATVRALGRRVMGEFRARLMETVPPEGGPPPGGNQQHAYGYVEAMPEDGFMGEWVIDGETYTATPATTFRQLHGPLEVGAYAHVHFAEQDGVKFALLIGTLEEGAGGHWGRGGGMGGHYFGFVEAMPDGRIGAWVIGGEDFEATENTQFVELNGELAVGAYVFVHYWLVDDAKVASVIGTAPESVGNQQSAFGYLESVPDGQVGDWLIDSVTYAVDDTTVLLEDYAPLAEGAFVMVRYFVNASGRNQAVVIAAVPEGAGPGNGLMGEPLLGFIEAIDDASGVWTIEGQAFLVHPRTRLIDAYAPLEVGTFVFVYFLAVAGENHAMLIASLPEEAAQLENLGFALGPIQAIDEGLIERWTIAGEVLIVTPATILLDDNGPLEVGVKAFALYLEEELGNAALLITSLPEPQQGPPGEQVFGALEAMPDDPEQPWIVAGVEMLVTEHTRLVENYATLEVGVYVFAHYLTIDGVNYATVIAAVPERAGGPAGPGGIYFGYVEFIPDGGLGGWTISGQDFMVDENTVLDDSQGVLDVGAYVRVRYSAQEDGGFYAWKIVVVPDGAGQGGQGGMGWGYFGQVVELPEGWIGQWLIGEEIFSANEETLFGERNGELAVGATVHVRYYVEEDTKVAMLIATVPEGAGGLLGDMNDDCQVNVLDIMQVANNWGRNAGQNGYTVRHDIDANGLVDFMDILGEANFWGNRCGQPEASLQAASEGGLTPAPALGQGSIAGQQLAIRLSRPQPAGEGLWQVQVVGAAAGVGGFELGLRLAEGSLQAVELAPWLTMEGRSWSALQRQEGQRLVVSGFSFGAAPASSGKGVLATLTLRSEGQPDLAAIYLRAADGQARPIGTQIR